MNGEYDSLLLDNQLCFPLYVCAKEIVNAYTPYLKQIGLTYTQYITMMVLWEEKHVRSKRLKERLFLDSGTLTPVLNKLAAKGLITKQRSNEDARDLEIALTPQGEQLKERAKSIPAQVCACLTGCPQIPELREALLQMMKILKNNKTERSF